MTHSTEEARPRITKVTVTVVCDLCEIEDDFDLEPDDLRAYVSTPCACGQRVEVFADVEANYRPEEHRA